MMPTVCSISLSNYDYLRVFDGLAPGMGGKASPALLVGDRSWDLTPLVGAEFTIQIKYKGKMFCNNGRQIWEDFQGKWNLFGASLHHITQANFSLSKLLSLGTWRSIAKNSLAVRYERLCHSEDWNREKNQVFMEILGFAGASENPHSKHSGKGNAQWQKARGLGLPQLQNQHGT